MASRRMLARWVVAPFALIGAACLLYLLAAVALGLIAVNADFRSTANGVPVHVRTNGVHAELVLPTVAGNFDWTLDHPASHMRALEKPLPWIAFGWGDRDFFVRTPTWADLDAQTAWVALSGTGEGAMHVEYIAAPQAYAGRMLRLSDEQFAHLVAYIRGSFRRNAAGRPVRLDAPGYFGTDAFYAAVPRYVFWFTSNDWVRRGLTAAGVRAPLWAPFDKALFYQLDRIDPESAKARVSVRQAPRSRSADTFAGDAERVLLR